MDERDAPWHVAQVVPRKNLASLHVPPVIFMSISSPIFAGGSQELDGQWLEEIASYGPPDLLLTPCLGIAPTGSRRQGCQNLWIGLRQLCLLGDEGQGQAKQRFAPILSRYGLFGNERSCRQ